MVYKVLIKNAVPLRERTVRGRFEMSGGETKITLIVPVYNVKRYLVRCLDSCVRQTLLDMEVLCVNDGSTDGSRSVLERYACMDGRIRIVDKENGGLSSARNAGMNAASGEWIMFLDADDYLEPDACERVWRESLEGRREIIAFGGTYFPDAPAYRDAAWLEYAMRPRAVRYRDFTPEKALSERGAIPFVWLKAFSAEFLRQNGLRFDETIRFAEDILFLLTAYLLAKRVSFLPDLLYHYRVGREGSLMGQMDRRLAERAEWHLRITERVFALWEEYGFARTYRYELGRWAVQFMLGAIKEMDAAGQAKILSRTLELLKRYGLEDALRELTIAQRMQIRRIRRGA